MKTLKNTMTDFAALNGSAKSPNLPHGSWDFVLTTDGDEVAVKEDVSKTKNDDGSERKYSFVEVTPAGNPQGTVRRIYAGTLGQPSAKSVMYTEVPNVDEDDKPILIDGKASKKLVLKSSFTGGVFTDKDRNSIVSSDADKVLKGIGEANARYSAQRAAEAAKKEAEELVGG